MLLDDLVLALDTIVSMLLLNQSTCLQTYIHAGEGAKHSVALLVELGISAEDLLLADIVRNQGALNMHLCDLGDHFIDGHTGDLRNVVADH